MPFFEFRPIEAQQFTGGDSIAAVSEIVGRYRPQVSWQGNPMAGTLRFHGSGSELNLDMNSWIVAIGGDVVVMSQAEFEELTVQQLE